jgi:hypothetical protein
LKLILSLDYELFLGHKTGSVENCMITPVKALLKTIKPYHAKISLFVDAGFLLLLKENAKRYQQLASDYDKIRAQLEELTTTGHDVQLHVHPHWQDCSFDGQKWQINSSRYKLHDFDQAQINTIIADYKSVLNEIVDTDIFAFRAGGWCLQPFNKIARALRKENIWLDSTVFANGISDEEKRWYNYCGAPDKSWWRFGKDPLVEDESGQFIEIPISSIRVSPLFFYKMILMKKFSNRKHDSFGDGSAIRANFSYYLKRLTRRSISVVSIDGLKASLLTSALAENKKTKDIFNIMGHPKAISPDSLKRLDHFLKNSSNLEPVTFQDFKHLQPGQQ